MWYFVFHVIIIPDGHTVGYFLVLRRLLLVSYFAVVWVLFSAFWIFCFTSFGARNIRNTKNLQHCVKRSGAGASQISEASISLAFKTQLLLF